jgi:hypothetical protein
VRGRLDGIDSNALGDCFRYPRPFLANLSVMIAFRLRGEIGGAATSPASDVQVGRSLIFMLRKSHQASIAACLSLASCPALGNALLVPLNVM